MLVLATTDYDMYQTEEVMVMECNDCNATQTRVLGGFQFIYLQVLIPAIVYPFISLIPSHM